MSIDQLRDRDLTSPEVATAFLSELKELEAKKAESIRLISESLSLQDYGDVERLQAAEEIFDRLKHIFNPDSNLVKVSATKEEVVNTVATESVNSTLIEAMLAKLGIEGGAIPPVIPESEQELEEPVILMVTPNATKEFVQQAIKSADEGTQETIFISRGKGKKPLPDIENLFELNPTATQAQILEVLLQVLDKYDAVKEEHDKNLKKIIGRRLQELEPKLIEKVDNVLQELKPMLKQSTFDYASSARIMKALAPIHDEVVAENMLHLKPYIDESNRESIEEKISKRFWARVNTEIESYRKRKTDEETGVPEETIIVKDSTGKKREVTVHSGKADQLPTVRVKEPKKGGGKGEKTFSGRHEFRSGDLSQKK